MLSPLATLNNSLLNNKIMQFYKNKLALVIATLITTSPNVFAQTVAATTADKPIEKIDVTETKTATKKTISIESASLPTAVTTVDRDEIERTNIGRDIGNLFRRVPGILANNLNQGEIGTSIKMRGFSTQTHGADAAVYIDGAAQNIPSGVINHGMNDMSWLSPEMIERVEVIKGPFSALYGDQNRSGAVNIITRTRADNSIAFSAGSFGVGRATGVYAGAVGAIQLMMIADYFRQDGYRAFSDIERSNFMVKASLTHASGNWALRANYQKSDYNAPGFLSINRIRAGLNSERDRDPLSPPLTGGNGERLSLTGTRTPTTGEAGLHSTVYYEDYQRRRVAGASLTDLIVLDDDRKIFGARALYNFTFRDTSALAVGADTRRDNGDGIVRRWVSGVPSANYTVNQDLDLLTYGVFAQGQIKLLDAVKLVGGIRHDTFDYDIRNRKLPAASIGYKKSVTTPRIGLVWSPLKNLDFYVNQGQGFRSPSQAELSPSGALGALGAAGGTANPGVMPSKVKSYDYGFNATLSTRWRVAGAVYHTLNQNEIIQISPGIFASVGDTTRDGWEIDTKYAVNGSLNVYASWGKIRKSKINNPLPNTANLLTIPEDTVKVGASLTQPIGNATLLLNADAFYISGPPIFAGAPLALNYVRPYSKYDFRATYEFANWQLTATVTLQPHKLSSEVVLGNPLGVLLDPRPRTEGLVSLRYRF